MITFKQKYLIVAGYITLALPLGIFMLGWLKLSLGILFTLILLVGLVFLCLKEYKHNNSSIKVSAGHLFIILALFVVPIFLSGIAQVGVSGGDIPYRNAIFADLVNFDWPVKYSSGFALMYYVTFWMVPACVGKLLGLSAAYVALFIYVWFIVSLVYVIILSILHIETPGKMWLVAAFVFLWSGMHYFAAAFMTMNSWNLYDYGILTDGSAYMDAYYNGEAFNWYYRCNYSVLSQTYNQLMIWLVVVIALARRKAYSYIALAAMLLPYSPWGFIGVCPLLLACGIPDLVKEGKKGRAKAVFKSIFSLGNMLVLIAVAVVFGSFFFSSTVAGGTSSSNVISPDQVAEYVAAGMPYTTQSGAFGMLSLDRFSLGTVVRLVMFWGFEFLIFGLFLFKSNKKNPLFWVIMVWLMVCPLLWMGTINGRDFCMNVSIPAFFALMILMLDHLKNKVCGKPLGFVNLALVLVLIFSLCGTVFDCMGRVALMQKAQSVSVVDNSIGTLSDKTLEGFTNFLKDNYNNTFFYLYLGK